MVINNKSWSVCGDCYSYEENKMVTTLFITSLCDNVHDAIKEAENYGIKNISAVFVNNNINANKMQKGASI